MDNISQANKPTQDIGESILKEVLGVSEEEIQSLGQNQPAQAKQVYHKGTYRK